MLGSGRKNDEFMISEKEVDKIFKAWVKTGEEMGYKHRQIALIMHLCAKHAMEQLDIRIKEEKTISIQDV